MTTILRIDKDASLPFLSDDTTPNPIWRHIIHAFATGGSRLRYRGGKLVVRDEDDWQVNKVQAFITLAEATHGAGTVNARIPCWLRINLARKDTPVPAYMPVADIDDPPRRPTYSELRIYMERDGFGWAPCSDGVDYFWSNIWDQLDAEPGIRVVNPQQVPESGP